MAALRARLRLSRGRPGFRLRTCAPGDDRGGLVQPGARCAVRELLGGWFALLAEVAREAEQRYGSLGPFTAGEVATLVSASFIGAEALLLLGFDREVMPIRSALRRFSVLIRQVEEGSDAPRKDRSCEHASRFMTATSSATASRSFTRCSATGEPTVLLLPTWSIIHSRQWKMQIPYLSRHCRVVTFDGRGNGRSDRPTEPEAYAETEFAADAIAVMDATQTDTRYDCWLLNGRAARPATCS